MVRRSVGVLAAIGLLAVPASAQSIRVRVVTEAGPPATGAIVKLLDRSNMVIRSGLSDEHGRVTLRAPRGGGNRIRADRIGFRGVLSESVTVPDTGTVTLELRMPDEPVVLAELAVTGTTRCQRDPTRAPATAALWTEIRKALDATAITRQSGLTFTMAVWRRALDSARAVTTESVDTTRTRAPRPFRAVGLDLLVERGYLTTGEDGTWTVFGPDEEVLLSSQFLATHCFGIATREIGGRAEVGLQFQPAPGRTAPDIAGALWVTRDGLELRTVEFEYVNLPEGLPQSGLNGRVEFARVPQGWWIVDRWWIRSPRVEEFRVHPGVLENVPLHRRQVVRGYLEDGGEVLAIEGLPRIRLGQTARPMAIGGRD